MQEDFKTKCFIVGRLDDGIDTIILPKSFNCDFLGCEKEVLLLVSPELRKLNTPATIGGKPRGVLLVHQLF